MAISGILIIIFAFLVDLLRGSDIVGILKDEYSGLNEKKRIHSKELVGEVFDKKVENGIIVYNMDSISKKYVLWGCDKDWLQLGQEHLEDKHYSIMSQAYVFGQNYAKMKIDEIEKKIHQYRNLTEQKIMQKLSDATKSDTKISFAISESLKDCSIKQYFPKQVNHLIYCDIQNILKNNEKTELRIVPSTLDGVFFLEWNCQTVATNDKSSIEFFKDMIEQIEKDKTILDIVLEISSLELQLQNNTELKNFNRERNEIVVSIMKHNKSLKGKCDGCP